MRYLALQPIKHNGKRVEPGKTVEMAEAEAGPLLASGVLQHEPRKSAAKSGSKADNTAGGGAGSDDDNGDPAGGNGAGDPPGAEPSGDDTTGELKA